MIDLNAVPELKGLKIIKKQKELEDFLKGLRQDSYPIEALAKLNFPAQLKVWGGYNNSRVRTFFAVHDEADSFTNDNWGHYELLQCVVIKDSVGQLHFFKKTIREFSH